MAKGSDPHTRATCHRKLPFGLLLLALLIFPSVAHAYVGPGAGVALLTTVATFLTSLLLALVGLLSWPFRQLYLALTRKKPPRPARIRRAVVVGLDGLDPDLVRRFMARGRLPHLKRIAERGMMSDLDTTYPAMSPVAWSSFATGVNPAKHGIFDFLTRDPRTYLPELSSARVGMAKRHLELGPYRIPLGKPQIRLLRKSKPFWKILGEHRIPCSILRVPITFPPEQFEGGTLLSAMCVPDLQGSQGTFTYFEASNARAEEARPSIGGQRRAVEARNGQVRAVLEGPENPVRRTGERLRIPFTVLIDAGRDRARLTIGKETCHLEVGKYSGWIPVAFALGLGLKLRGIVRFRLNSLDPFRLYASPINIDPMRPAMPISHPFIFSVFLAKLCGRFSTLGLAEDTWALNEGVLDEDAFLEQAWENHAERESMFFEMLRRTPRGLITCVFDGTDRIQHMFMRYLDDGHPAARGDHKADKYRGVIEETYARADAMLGKVLDQVDIDDPRTLLVILSDHGFKTFRRGVNLNSWLLQNGYLALEPSHSACGEWFAGVDWMRTRAFALGLGGIFLNVKGREAKGSVAPGGEAEALADEIAGKLTGLHDDALGAVAISACYASHRLSPGPYREDAPDVIVGYAAGWRASWDGVRGIANGIVFDDNTKAWSGDHCIDPKLVPGVLVASQRLASQGTARPQIADLAPTFLDLFGIPAPRYMDGHSLAGQEE